jgi:hypothetical protein
VAFASEDSASTPAVMNTRPPVIAVRGASLTALMFRALTPLSHGSAARSALRYIPLMRLPTHPTYPPDIEERAVRRLAHGGSAGNPRASLRKTRGGHSKTRESRPCGLHGRPSAGLNIGAGPESKFRAERFRLSNLPGLRLDGATDSSPNATDGRVQTTPLSC